MLLALITTSARAQEGLLDIYQRALINDPVIREAEAQFLATSEVKAQARSSILPSLSLSASMSDSSSTTDRPQDPVTGQPDPNFLNTDSNSESTNMSLNLSQTLFNWGQYLTYKQADKTIMRAETSLASAQQDLIIRVAQAYFNVLSAQDLLAADIAARDALELQLEQANTRFEVSLIPITDVQEAQAGYDQAVASVIGSQRTLATARESLREIINDYVTALRGPQQQLPLVTPNPENVDEWVDIAQAQNLALVAARIAAEIADDDVTISRSSRFPTLSLSASSSDRSSTATTTTFLANGGTLPGSGVPRESGGDSASISLSLNVPIFNGGANGSRVRQAVQQRRVTIETVERIARQTERQTRDAYLGVVSEISRVEALRQALQSTQTALESTQAAEEVGQRTRVDVVNALNAVRRAETTYASARYEYLMNILRLKQAAGSLTESDLAEIDDWLE
jgi:outer membrane protein